MPQIILEDEFAVNMYREFLEHQQKLAEDKMAAIQKQLAQLNGPQAVVATVHQKPPADKNLPAHVPIIKEHTTVPVPAHPVSQDQLVFNAKVLEKVKRIINTVEGPFFAKDLFSIVAPGLTYLPEEKLIAIKAIQAWLNADYNKNTSPFLRMRMDSGDYWFVKNAVMLMPEDVCTIIYTPDNKKRFNGVTATVLNILKKSKLPLSSKQVYEIIISVKPFISSKDRKLLQATVYTTLLSNTNGNSSHLLEMVKNDDVNVFTIK